MSWQRKLQELFGADLRSLAALRIGTALVLLLDLLLRARDLTAHYTDAGVLPRQAILGEDGSLWRLTPHLLGGSTAFQALLFVIAGLFAAMLLVGYRTQLATIVSWILLISLQQRNPWILFGGDDVLKVLMFWGIFLPWGVYFSVDRRRTPPPANPAGSSGTVIANGGTAAMMLQVAFIYLFTWLLKSGSPWRPDYTAIYLALSIDGFVGPIGHLLYRHPALMKLMTFISYWLEILAPILLFSPVFTKKLRLLAVLGIASLHIGIVSTMWVSFFPIVNLVSLLVFVPSTFWDRAARFAPGLAASSAELGRPDEAERWLAKVKSRAAMAIIVYVFFLNLGLPDALAEPGKILNIQQRWNMFAPYPLRDDGWPVVRGLPKGGGEPLDLLRPGEPFSLEKPEDPWVLYKHHRWHKYFRRLWEERGGEEFVHYPRFACTTLNRRQDPERELESVELIFMSEYTLADFQTAPIVERSLGVTDCPSVP